MVKAANKPKALETAFANDADFRKQVAKTLAENFLEYGKTHPINGELQKLIESGHLTPYAVIQKPTYVLQFYWRLFSLLASPPKAIFEIGVKGGASVALWEALFPTARIVGLDLTIRKGLSKSGDGVVYIEGDQSDRDLLIAIAEQHGPFDIVIDDGSHISDHQALGLRTLLPHVRGGGLYIVEDTHSQLKRGTHTRDYGDDIWGEFVEQTFRLLQSRKEKPRDNAGSRLAADINHMIHEAYFAEKTLAILKKSTSL